jgi:hypothetical protein
VSKKLDLDDSQNDTREKAEEDGPYQKDLPLQFLSLLKDQIKLDKEVEI